MSIYDQFPIFTDMGDQDLVTTKRKHNQLTDSEDQLSIPSGGEMSSYEENLLVQHVESLVTNLEAVSCSSPPSSSTKKRKTFQGNFSLFQNCNFKNIIKHQPHEYIQVPTMRNRDISKYVSPPATAPLLPPDERGIQLVTPYKIFPYQLEIVQWLYQRELNPLAVPYFTPGISGGIIAMLMGLGKTLVIAYLTMLTIQDQRKLQMPTLYVCPANLIGTAHREFHKFFGAQLKLCIFHVNFWGKAAIESMTTADLLRFDVIIISYSTLGNHMRNSNNLFENQWWYRVILDESQDIRNTRTMAFKAVMKLKCNRRVCMTGTPIHNHLRDVYHQLLFCGFTLPEETKVVSISFFKQYLLPHNILRDYTCVDPKDLVEKTEHIVIVPMHPLEATLHTQIMKTHQMNLEKTNTTFGKVHQDFVKRMRQTVDAELLFCVAPHLLYNPERQIASTDINFMKDRELLGLSPIQFSFEYNTWLADVNGEAGIKSSKLTAMVNILHDIHNKGDKVIIFANKVRVLELACKALPEAWKTQYRYVNAKITTEYREQFYSEFRTKDNVFMLFSTLTLGNRGLNLSEANHVIFLQPWYCWAPMEQAIYRAYRIGQTKPVHYYILLSQGTCDERIYQKVTQLATTSKEALDVMDIFT
jgi:non-specific serine/threonine protein kinase